MTTHRFTSICLFIALLATPVACGPSMDTEEATAVCDRLAADISCIDDDAHSQCIACHEECGRECSLLETCPQTFTCD